MIADVEAGIVKRVIIKDMSRFGRDYLQVGMYTEIMFPEHDVHFIAVNDGVDSNQGDNEFTPFRNIINEWYAKDTSKKIRAVMKVKGNAGGITYSDAKYTIETTITDNGDGTLKAEHVLKGTEPAEFKNTYSVTPLDAELDFDLSKAIDGRDWTDSDKFSFTITAPEGTPLPEPATVTVSKKDAKDGIAAIKFAKIHYTAAGAYKYEIRENAGSAAGMTYDGHVATAEVTVTDNGKGVLTANVTKKESGRFTNTYRSELDYAAAGGLKLSKTLYGRPMTEG